jgi:general stress protein 26
MESKPPGIKQDPELFFKTSVVYYDQEKTEKMGLDIEENGKINICFAEIDAIMPVEDQEQVIVFLKGIHLTVNGDYKKVKANWETIKKQQYEAKA